MRLLRIELEGFKSFADYTCLEFGSGITCIVGPNGCGKSNIVDAARWVLGELNPRTLRGKSMSDVIFHGNRHRRGASMAEVSLTFLDEDQLLGTGKTEVQVARRLHRSGESEYLLNGERVRLKDIRQMFMDTGVGMDTYSVMEQGKVDKLLQAGTKERRYIFEEAAGISKFKNQRRETLRRLERVQGNLERLNDVLTEVDSRLRAVKKQADKALTYQKYEGELQELGLTLARARDRRYAQQLGELLSSQAELEETASELSQRRSEVTERVKALEAQLTRTRDGHEQTRRELVRQRELRAAGEDQAAVGTRRLGEIEADEKRLRAEQQRLEALIGELAGELERLEAEADRLQRARQTQAEALEAVREEETKIKADADAVEQSLEGCKARGLAALEARARASNELAAVEAEARSVDGRKLRVLTRREQLELRVAEGEQTLEGLTGEVGQADEQLVSLRAELVRLQGAVGEVGVELEGLGEQIADTRDRRARATSRLELLESLDRQRAGLGKAASWLLDNDVPGVKGTVADLLEVPEEHAPAVAAALGSLAEAVVVKDAKAARKIADQLAEEGLPGAALIPLAGLPAPDAKIGKTSRLSAFVKAAKGATALRANLLDDVELVDDLDAAMESVPGVRKVTPEGHLVDRGRVLLLGHDQSGGLILRKSEIKARKSELKKLEKELGTLERTRAKTIDRRRDLQEQLDARAGEVHSHELGTVSLRQRLEETARQLEALREEDQLLADEVEELSDAAVGLADRSTRLAEQIARHQAAKDEADQALEALAGTRGEQRAELEAIGQKRSNASVLLAQTQEKEHAARALLEAARRDHTARSHERESAAKGEAECASRREATLALIEEQTASALAALERIGELETQRDAQAAELTKVDGAHRAARDELQVVGNQLESVREQLGELAVARRELEVARDNLHQRTSEELGIDLTGAEAPPEEEASGEQDLAGEPVILSAKEMRALEKRYLATKRKIKRLGPINIDAIDELTEHQERSDFLHREKDDLVEARDSLVEIITRLDSACKTRFLDSFTLIRDNFRALFRKLFGGGKADLILEDPDDLLETGIEIVAKPPGKQPRTISLLSGGERAMTAIALLFSVYQTRPSPFCLLDEIDAPLDQANIDRFTQLVQEFLDESQFIVITHSKQTMTVADTLFGVTAGNEPGVSRLVSVRLENAEQLALG